MVSIKTFVLNTCLIGASIGISLLLVELVLHITPFKLKYLYPLEPGGYLQHDQEIGFDIVPSFATSTHSFTDLSYPVWSNRLGCFDREYDGTSPYIYVTGDSFTWGFTPFENKWGKVVEREIGIRTLTCGVNAFGTRQELIKTKRDLEKFAVPPQYIVVGYFEGNDLGDDFAFPNFTSYKGYHVPNPSRCNPETLLTIPISISTTTCAVSKPDFTFLEDVKFELSLRSVLYMMAQRHGIQDKIKNLFKLEQIEWPNTNNDQTLAWELHSQSIKSFKELAATYQSELLFVLIPERETVRAKDMPGAESVHEKIKTTLAAEGIAYVDLLPEFRAAEKVPEHLLYWPINEHWNVAGNELAGEVVSRYLEEKLSI